MPKQGVASSFKFGMNYLFLRACLVSCEIPFAEVTPRTWMKALAIRTRRKTETTTQWKNHLKQIAQQLFPQQPVTLATCDALLIAEYCRRLPHLSGAACERTTDQMRSHPTKAERWQ